MDKPTDYVFMHGGGQGGWVWQETMSALKRQGDADVGCLLALDAPGCGEKRARATEHLSMEDIGAELISDIEVAGAREVILVGHSQAGQAMSVMVQRKPRLFRRLIYVSCSAPLPGQDVLQMIGGGLHGENESQVGWPVDPKTSSTEERFALMFCNDMSDLQKSQFLAKLGKDMWPRQSYTFTGWTYEHIDAVPATYVVCLKDLSLPARWQKTFAARLKAQRLVRLDAGHQAMNTRPESLAEILRIEAL